MTKSLTGSRLLIAAFLAGILGGLFAGWLIPTTSLWAEPASAQLKASSFILVDDNGTLRGVWRTMPDGAAGLVMVRPDGETLSGQLMVAPDGEGEFALFDRKGKAIWQARTSPARTK